jgi:hypothetical protein
MDVSCRPPNSRRQVSGTRSRRPWWLVLVSGLLALLLGFTVQVLGFSRGGDTFTAYSAPITHLDATPTTAVSAPTLTLAVPSSGQGPVGAHITVIGSNWATADVLVGVAAPGAACSDPSSWVQTFNRVRPQADSSIVFTFDWPNTLTSTGGSYSICASSNAGVASVAYQLASLSSPTLTLNPPTTNAGSIVAVSGANFVGSGSVTLSVTNAQGKTHELTTLSPNGSGGFDLSYQPRPTDLGDVTLRAFTSAPQGMRPALDVTAMLHVDAALTPTPGVTPTVPVVTQPTRGNSDSTLVVILVVVAAILLALLVTGSVLFFMMRNRKKPEDGSDFAPGYFGGSGPGYGRPGNIYSDMYQDNGYGGMGNMGNPGWDAPTQGLFTYHESGYAPQPGYENDAGGWPESDEPDPDWRPRPMTGQWHAPEDYNDAPYGTYGGSANHPPPDPWANPEDSYGQPGQPRGTDQSYDGTSRGGYPPYGPRSRGSGGEPGRGSGGGTRGRYPEQPPDDAW